MIPDLVIFDCDGVLVDSEGPVSKIIAANLTRHGLPIEEDEVDALFTGGTMNDVEVEGRRRGADLPTDWLTNIYDEMFARLAQGVPTFDGVFGLLDGLDAAGVPHYIASNGPTKKMRITLGPSGLWNRFGGDAGGRILSRHDHIPKPDPAMILHAMSQTGARASHTIMIDDSVPGCRAGLNAGVRTIGFATEGQDETLAKLGAEVANSMADVHRMILG